MITVLYFVTLKTKLRIKINASQNMSNVLMLQGPMHLVCKCIIFNVYFTNDYCFTVFNFENKTKD